MNRLRAALRTERGREVAVCAALVLAVLWHVGPMLAPGYASSAIVGTDSYRSHDWLEVAKFDHYARTSLLEWGTLPLWNPLLAGGIAQFTHPSDGSTSPLVLTSVLFGETLGMKLNVAFALLVGTLGLYALLRRGLALSRPAAFAGALVYAWSGWLPARVAVGFYEVCLLAAVPALLALWTLPGALPVRRRRWALAALLLWALAIQLQLAVPVLVLLMGLYVLFRGLQQVIAGERLDPSLALGGFAILAVAGLLGGIKFLPMLDALNAGKFRKLTGYPLHPDAWYASFQQLWYALFHHVPNNPLLDRDGNPRIQEYMTLMPGLGGVLLCAVGLPLALRRRAAAPWAVLGAVFLWLSFGPHAVVDGFRPLTQLPFFSSMRGPLRYVNWPILMTIALCAGVGFDAVRHGLERRGGLVGGRAAVLLIGVLIGLQLPSALESRTLYRSAFLYPIEDLPTPDPLFSEGIKGTSAGGAHRLNLRKYVNIRRGVPTIYDPEDLPMKVGAQPLYRLSPTGDDLREVAYVGEAWLANRDGLTAPAGSGTATLDGYRAQRIAVSWDAVGPATVMLNQNGVDGWTCGAHAVSAAARNKWGLLGFEVPAGAGSTECVWRPRLLGAGIALSGLGFLALLTLWPWRRSKRSGRREGAERPGREERPAAPGARTTPTAAQSRGL